MISDIRRFSQNLLRKTSGPVAVLGLLLSASLTVFPASGQAQRANRHRLGGIPRDVSLEAARVFNAADTKRVRGDFTLAAGDTIAGDLAVLGGNLRLLGVVSGQVLVLNGNVTLLDQAQIGQSLTVLGGTFESPDRPGVNGEIRVWSARYRYQENADTIVAETEFLSRWSQWTSDSDASGTSSQLFVTSAHTYNRVEGLPVYVGPRFRTRAENTRVSGELYGIIRTLDGLAWKPANLGHRVMLELRQGDKRGFVVGGRLFDEVDAVERWQLTDGEVGLNSFLFTRDYRDYWNRHGGTAYAGFFVGKKAEVTASFGRERWSSSAMRDVWSLFSSDHLWRFNPAADNGVVDLFTLKAVYDTRNDDSNPRSGWYLQAEYEQGRGDFDRLADLTFSDPGQLSQENAASVSSRSWTRALFDFRRYNRVGPRSQLNLRVVAAGALSGDPLPAERRLSVSGIDALPGFDFRRMPGTDGTTGSYDVGTCATGTDNSYRLLGRPAQCERIILTQAEFKGDLRINLFGKDNYGDSRWRFNGIHADGTWVLFANAGRGWLVNAGGASLSSDAADALLFESGRMPSPGTWNVDLGGGFDFGDFGVYIAQAVSRGGLSPNIYMRLSKRF